MIYFSTSNFPVVSSPSLTPVAKQASIHPAVQLVLDVKKILPKKAIEDINEWHQSEVDITEFMPFLELMMARYPMMNQSLWAAASIALPWRFSKIVVRLDPLLLESLSHSNVDDIPFSVLNHLPFTSFYIELDDVFIHPGTFETLPCVGCLVFYEESTGFAFFFAVQYQEKIIWCLSMIGSGKILEETDENSKASIQATLQEMKRLNAIPMALAQIERNDGILKRVLAICLYLSSKGADYQPPIISQAVKTRRRGVRFFERSMPQEVYVGSLIGKTIARFYEERARYESAGKVIPHLRRAHFALYHKKTGDEVIWRAQSFINANFISDHLPLHIRECNE